MASEADADGFDFSTPASTVSEASPHVVGGAFAVELGALEDGEKETGRARVLSMLACALQMHAKLELPKDPYGPMMQWDDRRTAIPGDWAGGSAAVLVRLGTRASNPVIKARLYDVAWFLERGRVQTGHDAAAAYLAVAAGIVDGTLRDSTGAGMPGVTTLTLEGTLRRGLQIAAQLRPPEPEKTVLSSFVLAAADRFDAAGDTRAQMAMLRLAHNFDLDDNATLAARIERVALSREDVSPHDTVEALTMAAGAWRAAGQTDGYERCLMAASAVFVSQADRIEGNFAASHWIQQAIGLLRGLRSADAKVTKRDLRIRLIRMQEDVNDEMSTYEFPIDLRAVIEETTARLEHVNLLDGLFGLADIERSPDPERLAAEARSVIAQSPFSAMFAVAQYDAHGRVRYRAPGAMPGQVSPEALEHQIARMESQSRSMVVHAKINVVVKELAFRFPIAESDLFSLLRQSIFVPPDLVRSYVRGLASFLRGDMIPALSILAPLLEASMLHVLKAHDVDVVHHDEHNETQEDMSIQRLFTQKRAELDSIFGRAITDDIDRVFLARSGPALRHAVAHGDLQDSTPHSPDSRYGCWLLFRLCLIPLFEHYEEQRASAGGGLSRMAMPD
jgi:hypothetical protein